MRSKSLLMPLRPKIYLYVHYSISRPNPNFSLVLIEVVDLVFCFSYLHFFLKIHNFIDSNE